MFELDIETIENLTKMMNDLLAHCRHGRFICLLPHVHADGDAWGAALALATALTKLGGKTAVFTEEDLPKNLQMLPFAKVEQFTYPAIQDKYVLPEDSVAVVVDCGGGKRLGSRETLFNRASYRYIIDHHIADKAKEEASTSLPVPRSADIIIRDSAAAATCEIVGCLLKEMENKLGQDVFDYDIAKALTVGLLTDTGRFCYSNTRVATHALAAYLHKFKVPVNELAIRLFDTMSPTKLRLSGILGRETVFTANNKFALCSFDLATISQIKPDNDDFEGFSSQLRNIDGVEVGIILKEEVADCWRASVRSGEYFDSQKLATYFAGGGHKRAAGFTYHGKLKDLLPLLQTKVEEQLNF